MAHPSPNPVYRGSPVCLDELDFPATSLRRDSPVEQLIAVVTRSLFASDCAVRHLANGAWNTVYVVTLTQPRPPYIPQTVVCRVSLAAKTDSCLSIQSEVDTMMYVLGRTRIPIPKIYAYCTNGNVLSQTYMFLEHITTGQRMREAFELLDEAGRARAIREYAGVVHRLSQLRFSRIGSLLRTPAPGRGEPEYTVAGPSMVRSNHSERAGQRTHTALERPFTAVVPWLLAMEEDELRFVRAHPERVAEWSNFFAGKSLNEVVEIVCTVLRSVIKEIPRACDTGPLSKILCLWHYDLNSG
ncbi:hypothetical protein CALCODRAFT_349869 [Calocera cornea HHB12733]|uniref:Uncharacterized protein n=1 Tax=Calocera cornea HHB12733 TaxID=1353952 RepID=A0A165JEP1_9BASI|nr:hypothetical protein CALCODRAFT_349869 [Calocera cornea HHB12733]